MKVSRAQMAENRQRILEEAGRLFRARGFEAVGVAEVMQAAGLTHGGFYGHFASKDELVALATARLLESDGTTPDLPAYLDAYLCAAHRDEAGTGCPLAGLAGTMRHQGPAARAALADGMRSQLARFGAACQGADEAARRRTAIGTWAAMVGAMVLARAVDDPALSDEILSETRGWIAAQSGEFSTPKEEEEDA